MAKKEFRFPLDIRFDEGYSKLRRISEKLNDDDVMLLSSYFETIHSAAFDKGVGAGIERERRAIFGLRKLDLERMVDALEVLLEHYKRFLDIENMKNEE